MTALGWNPLIDVADVLEVGDRVAWHYAAEQVSSATRQVSDALRRRQLASGQDFEPPTQTREPK